MLVPKEHKHAVAFNTFFIRQTAIFKSSVPSCNAQNLPTVWWASMGKNRQTAWCLSPISHDVDHFAQAYGQKRYACDAIKILPVPLGYRHLWSEFQAYTSTLQLRSDIWLVLHSGLWRIVGHWITHKLPIIERARLWLLCLSWMFCWELVIYCVD